MSSTDALNYLAKMSGIGRKTVGKSVQRLADKEVIWIVEEGGERRRHRGLEARRFFKKHFLIVGLSYELSEG
jgi:Mn-dependent DtxR family transcriptional regulator|tara:strand:+ start:15805 stop:16020 length:216 start_codon:yes stop_codon:yes gene_type:complete